MKLHLEGYHNTEESNVENIITQGFSYKPSEEHWLGQGIYFFADIDTAIDNINMLNPNAEVKTIAVEIDVDSRQFLDLDIKRNLNSFRKYCQMKTKLLKDNGQELIFKEDSKKKAMLKYKCFFMDLFKEENNYAVVSKTFAKDNPPYAEPIDYISYLGLPFLEKYICVSGNEYIVKKNLVEKEWFV